MDIIEQTLSRVAACPSVGPTVLTLAFLCGSIYENYNFAESEQIILSLIASPEKETASFWNLDSCFDIKNNEDQNFIIIVSQNVFY